MSLSLPDKKCAQLIGLRLRNLLKLPKAHKWVCYEWFYSNIDRSLFEGENDFCICLKETFPQLKARKLTRVQWCKIRRLMGKPRRCSPAFFNEERSALHRKRDKIRQLQQRKTNVISEIHALPDEIPMPLVIGTRVTARLRSPQDGLFTGVVDAVDFFNNTYRINFDRPGLGSHSVPDIEVLSNEPQETMPLSVFQNQPRPPQRGMFTPPRFNPSSPGLLWDHDPLLGSSPVKPSVDGTCGGFPVKLLAMMTRVSRILTVKKDKIKQLKDMNTAAEKMKSHETDIDVAFQQRYASLILDLDRLNHELHDLLLGLQQQSQEVSAPEQSALNSDQTSDLKKKSDADAVALVSRLNCSQGKRMVRQEKSLDLITKLTSLVIQIKTFAESSIHSFEFKSLQETMDEIRASIDPQNLSVLQNNVEIHVNHIQSGLTQMGNLSAFAANSL
ncbi:hypothetical protein CAPTEDRAFT_99454 [Capitella teleta]|uniref:DIRP domain-containing protein n=1 Tax=Capitella teleta TaxID=283909 RepID=R7VGH4_CAPTE|nr:hypothetical protein CAPTEDRAFT_99454 [Capitella teleta]|eukprot:ELU17953.1 hypothetical protein CAPTEDRAFT_99454 [Capitella teleta]